LFWASILTNTPIPPHSLHQLVGGLVVHLTVSADADGYAKLLTFAREHASGRRIWAIEGTGSFGAGLTTHLLEHAEWVVEIDRPKRPARRNGAKTDELDALRAAREALSREHLAQPRRRGDREALRVLLATRKEVVKTGDVRGNWTMPVTAVSRGREYPRSGRSPPANQRSADSAAVVDKLDSACRLALIKKVKNAFDDSVGVPRPGRVNASFERNKASIGNLTSKLLAMREWGRAIVAPMQDQRWCAYLTQYWVQVEENGLQTLLHLWSRGQPHRIHQDPQRLIIHAVWEQRHHCGSGEQVKVSPTQRGHCGAALEE
jgi:transposase